jgi:hypothetical protein
MPDLPQTAPSATRSPRSKPQTGFSWRIYGSATLAGLAVLIPVPFVDAALELFFRRRMAIDIARYNNRTLPSSSAAMLSQANPNWVAGCLLLPFRAVLYLFKDIFRTVLYALTVADATERVSEYWYRAFLINYAIQRGDIDTPDGARVASAAIRDTLKGVTTSPLRQLAQELISRGRGQFARLRTFIPFVRNRDRRPDQDVEDEIKTAWADLEGYLVSVAVRYDDAFDQQRAEADARAAELLQAGRQ